MTNDRRMVWLLSGLLAGLGLASFWPTEHVHAIATDSTDRFAVTTVEVGPGFPEAIFVLDFSTGRLTGGLLNPQAGQFTNFYFRDIAADFQITQRTKPKYAMITGNGAAVSGQSTSFSMGLLYIAELMTGKVAAYRFPYRITREQLEEPLPVDLFAYYSFRDARSPE